MKMEFKKKSINLSVGDVTYFVGGEGSPLLYIHGAGGLLITDPLHRLAGSHRLYMPIMPGLDGTEFVDGVDNMEKLADLIADFIKTVIEDNCDVLGFSFGGWLASWLVVRHPELVELLVLESPAGFRPEGKGGMPSDPKEQFRTLYAHPEKCPPDDRPQDMAPTNRKNVAHYHQGIALDEELLAQMGNIQSSTLLLYGTLEERIPIETCRILKDNIPRCFFTYVYDAAHGIEVDQPERFTDIVADFLARGEAFLAKQSDVA